MFPFCCRRKPRAVDSETVVRRWRTILRKIQRRRRLQRIWHWLGEHLKGCIGEGLRPRLKLLK